MNAKLNILLVEDNPGDAVLLREMTCEAHAEARVNVAKALAEALDAAAGGAPDVLLADLNLPDSRGLDTVRQLLAAMPRVPMVLLTDSDDEELAAEALRQGAQDYIVKGQVNAWILRRAIRYAIDRKLAQLRLQESNEELERKVRERTADLAHTLETLQDEVCQRLAAEEQRQQAEIEALRAVEREQRRIGRDLHDSVQGNLTGIAMMLQAMRDKLANPLGAPQCVEAIDRLVGIVRQTIEQTRGLARGLCPVELRADGLQHALAQLAMNAAAVSGVDCQVDWMASLRVEDEEVATHLYYIAQEAVANALKHARAGTIRIGLHRDGNRVRLTVVDDGIGLPADTSEGMGMQTMRLRAKLIGGCILAERLAEGTRIACDTPLNSFIAPAVYEGTVPLPAPQAGKTPQQLSV